MAEKHGSDYDGYKADIWQIGVCLYAMIYGDTPFNLPYEEDNRNLVERIVNGRYQRNLFQFSHDMREIPLSLSVLDMISQLLNPDPVLRINMAGLRI